MPKILILEATQVDYNDDRGGQHVESSEIVDVPKEQARKLTEYNRALYVSKSDDPTKAGLYTASKDMLEAAKAMAAARAAAAKTEQADG
jgi:hypothetical protein